MNLFNSFQAVAFYTITPFGIQWLFANDHSVWGYILCAAEFSGFVLMSNAINKSEW